MAPSMLGDFGKELAIAGLGRVLVYMDGIGTGDDPVVEIWVDGVYQGRTKVPHEVRRPFVLPEPVALRPYVFSGPPPRGTARNTAQWKKERR